MRPPKEIRAKARELLDQLHAEGRAMIPLGHEIDPVARAGTMMGASLVVNHAARQRPDVRFALATGRELKRPEASWVFIVWLEGGPA
jgi:hypothetical protein